MPVFEGAFQNIVNYTAVDYTGVPKFVLGRILEVTQSAQTDLNARCLPGSTSIDPDTPFTTRAWVIRASIRVTNAFNSSEGCDPDALFPERYTPSRLGATPETDRTFNYADTEKPGTPPYPFSNPIGVVPKDPDEPVEWYSFSRCSDINQTDVRCTTMQLGHEWRPGLGAGNLCYNYLIGSSRAWQTGDPEPFEDTLYSVNVADIGDMTLTGNDTGQVFRYKPLYFVGDIERGSFGQREIRCIWKREDLLQ